MRLHINSFHFGGHSFVFSVVARHLLLFINYPEQARRHKPCVVFIDELDAVGGARVASSVHPYSRMTLNQLLVEMDGYKELEGVVIIGATNFPESLDKLVKHIILYACSVHSAWLHAYMYMYVYVVHIMCTAS